jgi:hypothetical protein
MGTLREILLSIGTWTYVVVGLDILLESSAFLGLVLNWQLLDSIPAPVGGGITGAIFLGILAWTAWKYRLSQNRSPF